MPVSTIIVINRAVLTKNRMPSKIPESSIISNHEIKIIEFVIKKILSSKSAFRNLRKNTIIFKGERKAVIIPITKITGSNARPTGWFPE